MENYLPVLMIFENAWEEKILNKVIGNEKITINWDQKNKIKIKENNKFYYNIPIVYLSKDESFEDNLEKNFQKVWKKRWENWNKQNSNSIEELKRSLIFYKFMMASPKMIAQLKKIMSLNLKKKGSFLPAILQPQPKISLTCVFPSHTKCQPSHTISSPNQEQNLPLSQPSVARAHQ